LSQFLLSFSYKVSYKIIDRGIIEVLGPMGLSNVVNKKSFDLYKLQTGFLYHYAFVILLGVTLLIGAVQFLDSFLILVDFRLIIVLILTVFFSPIFKK
tara:strand:- start:1213 stop:1506 length:294 start_codon:yes stop_codon:yes gene_type:complete